MKNFLLFNQFFGTVGSPNQTDETLTRENRIGLMSYLHRTLMLLFAVLVMSIANIGMAWGAEATLSVIGTDYTLVDESGSDVTSWVVNSSDMTKTGTSVSSYSNITQIVVTFSTLGSSNAGKFMMETWVGDTKIDTRGLIAKKTGTALSSTTQTITVSSLTGAVKVKLSRTTSNSNPEISSIAITYSAAPASAKYTLSYDANGGTGSMPTHEFASGTTVYAAQNAGFTAPSGKIFKCWNTNANGSGTSYGEWESFTLSANTTLYAQWITASTSSTYCISLYNLNVSDQMKYFTYSGSNDMQILDLEVPNYKTSQNNFWVGKGGEWKSSGLGNSNAKSAEEKLEDLCLKGNRGQKLGTGSQGVLARFFIYDNSTYNNLYIEFTPKQYSLIWGTDGSSWSPVKLYPSGYENEWTSEVVTLTSDQISSYKYYVGTLKADNGVAFWYKSKTLTVGSMGTYNKRTNTWGGNVSTLSAGAKGFFRMWQDATDYDNWRCHFVPVYTLSYNANGGDGAPASAYTATEGDDAARTLKVSTTEPTRTGYTFEGWAVSSAHATAGTVDYASGASITLSADQELWAVWTPKPYTITLNGNGGSGNTSSVTATYNSSTLSSSITNPTLDCYTFDGWYSGEGGSGTLIINTSGVLQASTTYTGAGGIWTNDGAVTLYAKWSKTPTALTVNLGGDPATPAGGSPIGTEYTLTCSASTGVIASYQWKQNTTASTAGAVNAEGTGATTASFSPVPAAAGTYYYYCVATDACGNSVNTSFSGAFQFNEPVDPCSEPTKVTNEIARFFVPCGLSNATSGSPSAWTVNQDASTGDNTFTTSGFGGGSSNWYRNETSGLIYGKLSGDNSYIQLKLKSGNFQAGDVVTAYFNRNDANKSGLTLKTQGSSYAITPASTAAGVETSGSYTLVADAIEADGSIKLFRANSSSYVNRIIVTRPPVAASVTATLLTSEYMPTGATGVQIGVEITGASTGWYYRVKKGGGYETPDNTTYTTTTWTMTSTIGDGANTYTVELYNGSGTKMAESNAVTVTGETGHQMTIAAGEGGSASPASTWANGDHLHPEITATPASGYHFVNWTKNNENATLANANAATTTITNASGACTITANFEADAPVATPMITYNLNVGTSASASIGTSGTSTDPSNITSIAISQANAAGDGAGASNKTTKLPLATGENAASVDNPDKYVLFTFNVACGKKLTPSEVKIKVANVGSSAGGNQNYKAVLSDAYGHSISNTFTGTKGDGTVEEFSITNGGGTYFQGNVTLKLWSCKGNDGNASAFRMGTPLTIYGVIGDEATPAATITWNTQPADGQVGSADFAYAVSCSDGSAVTVTSDDTNIATIEDGKLHYVAEGTTHLVATATDACGNTITQNSNDFTVTAASVDPDPEPGDCEELFAGSATSTSVFTIPVGSATTALSSGNSFSAGGYSYSVKPNSSNAIVASPKDGGSFAVGDSLIVVVYNNQSGDKTMGFKLGSGTYTTSVGSKKLHIFRQVLVASDISAGKVTFNRQSSDDRWVEIIIKHCGLLPSCTTPELSDLEDQKVCLGEDVSWTANITNTATLQDGEIFAYQWNKKGNNTVLSSDATLTLNDVTEAAGGTYVVTAIVSAEGKASATATKEVTLTVTPATATPTITANANTIYTGNDVTLTASCASNGVGYQWYTCTDAEGTNPQAIGGETNATYTFTAGEAGTYYYKVIVTGDGTHSCGTAEKVYTLVVSASNSGETTCGEIKGQFKNGAYTFDTDVIIYGINSGGNLDLGASSTQGNNRCGGSGSFLSRQRFAVTFPVDVLSFSFIGYQPNLRTVEAVKTTTDLKTADTEYTTITHTVEPSQEGNCQTHVITPETAIPANTFVWVELNNGLNISEICYVPVSNVNCTDPQVIATVDNATVCEDTENVTFTATNYADGAEFQWQKKNGNAWENIDATSATYTISPVTTEHAGQYRVIATKEECSRTSEELTLTVLTAPEFNAFANTASVMKGNALTINDVEATNATDYTWYKSADNSFDVEADTKVGTTKELLLAASSITEEADQAFYLFCVASNSCGSVTSNAITVTVTPFVEEECATAGNEDNEGEHEFGFDEDTECSLDTYGDSKTPVWKTNSRSKYLTYTAPEGKYFATAKVTVAHTGGTTCGYAYSTNRGATWVVTELEGLSTTLTAITIELPANVNAFRISRNLTAQDGEKGSDSGNFYLAEACFTYENACTPTSVTPMTTSYEYNISTPADFEEPPFTVKHGEDIVNDAVLTYTSSNPAIATVDEEGSVTFEGMTGTVTITAAYAGTTIDEIEYCASEGSYTITVVCQDEEPKIIAATSTNLDGCNNSITLEAKMQDGNSFTGGTFQWYRDGEAIDGATSASYEVVRAGTYTVSRTYTCTTMSSISAVVTNENPEPKVERLTPFQYYHVDKDYSDQMKDRHLFAVTSYGTSDGKRYHLTATRNGEALDLSSSTAFSTIPSSDNAVDTVMIDLNELEGKYNANDEIVITCAPIDNCNQVSTITSSITIHVIDQTPTLALICSGANGDGTRDTEKLVVGGDFLTGYNKADLCQQTGNQTFDPNTEWGFYEALQDSFIVTPVNGYAQFNKLNYEPFDILLLTDYPKSSKSEAAQKIIDDMAELCDYRPLLSFKTHFQSDKWKDKTTGEYKYTKWVKKGFTTAPVVPKQTATYVNIVCYAHPMFKGIDNTDDEYTFHDDDDPNQLVYQVLTGPGYEGDKGIQGFELADADNFVTIGLVHYNAQANKVTHDDHTHISWSAEANDRLLVAMAERQTNIEARMMLFSLNCGAQSLQTEGGRRVILQCLKYLLETDPLEVADCRMTFDNGEGNDDFDQNNYEGTGTRGDGLWSTAANWGPDYLVVPGRNNDVRIAAPCIVDGVKTKVSVGNEVQETIQYYPEVLSIHITENGSLTIPANSSLTARSTILRADENGNVYPTNVADISLGSNAGGNASLILNNERGDTKAGVAMYSTAKADTDTYSAAASTWQYIGTPHSDVANAIYNYYDSWLYQYDTGTEGWVVIPNGGPLVPFRGYCVTHPESPHTYWMEGTLVSTTNQDISIPANRFVVVANSWTAPIQINELTDDDMEGLTDKTIYFFNTGSDPEGDNTLTANATGDARWAEGTYISVPIHSASYTGDSIIPSMQGFYVVGGNADGTLHLDYERHVRAKRENVPSGPMHAPARITDTDNEPQVAKFLFRGKRYDDRLIILERPDFTRGYDSGWDGEQWGGNAAAPMSYVVTETRWDAVSAIPEYEGTVIAFRAGEDSEYTIHFDYDGMEEALYLLDTDTQIYTRVLKGNSYTFTCTDKAEHNRFILTRKAPQIATGVGNVSGDEVQGTKAKKLLIEDKMFIMVNGVLYDATGKVVK